MDYIEMFLKSLGDIAEHLMGKEKEKEIVIQNEISTSYELYLLIMQLTSAGQICEAEDILFSELDKCYTEGKYLVGIEFYEHLKRMDVNYLRTCDYSPEEIELGLEMLNKRKIER